MRGTAAIAATVASPHGLSRRRSTWCALVWGLWLIAALGSAGCQRETTPPLIQVLSLSPREVEEGDRIGLEGVGFPEGKVAHIAFTGDLHRPGTAPVTAVEIDVDAVVASSSEIDVPMTAALQQRFAGSGERAVHTTFRGDVTVAFAARAQAAPPVAGTLHDAWLDVRPPPPRRAAAERDDDQDDGREGERTLAFLGIQPQVAPLPSGGVLIEGIQPGSRAETARLLPGDVITEMGGVRVLSVRDLVPSPGDPVAWLKIRRGGSPREEVATVSLVGWKPPALASLLQPVVILSLSAALLLLFFAPTPRGVEWLERAVAARVGAAGWRLPSIPIALAAGGSLMAVSLPCAHAFGLFDLDAGILFLASLTALASLALVAGGRVSGGRFSPFAALRASARVLGLGVPAGAALVSVVVTSGSLGVGELVRAQSGWPWGWTVFKSPLAFLLFGLAAASLVLGAHADPGPLPEAAPATPSALATPRDPHTRLLFLAGWGHRVVVSTLATALFLGGWLVPGLAPERMEAHLGWTILGSAIFVVKVWGVVLALAAADWALPRVRVEDLMPLCWRWLAPFSVGGLLLTVLTTQLAWTPAPRGTLERLVAGVLVALSAAVATHVALRVRSLLRQRPAGVDPFV